MDRIEDVVRILNRFAVDHDLERRALAGLEGCWAHVDASEMAFPRHDAVTEVASISLTFQSDRYDYPFVSVRIAINVDNFEVGYYRLIVGIDGSVVDDYFALYEHYRPRGELREALMDDVVISCDQN